MQTVDDVQIDVKRQGKNMGKKDTTNYPQEAVDQRDCVPYTQSNRSIAKSIQGAILLQQIVYWYGKMGNQPFYKLKEPCDSQYYQFGESWAEELGFSRREFDTCLKLFAKKIKCHEPRDPSILVHYWVDFRRLTFYEINLELYANLKSKYYEQQAIKFQEYAAQHLAEKDALPRKGGNALYDKKSSSRKGGNALYVKAESAVSVKCVSATGSLQRLQSVDYSENVITTTTEDRSEADPVVVVISQEVTERLVREYSANPVVTGEIGSLNDFLSAADYSIQHRNDDKRKTEVSVMQRVCGIERLLKTNSFYAPEGWKIKVKKTENKCPFTKEQMSTYDLYKHDKHMGWLDNHWKDLTKRAEAHALYEQVEAWLASCPPRS